MVVSISAFNHPLNLAFVALLKEAGMPEDWCQAVICDNDTAQQLATDPRVGFLSFIGSSSVGWHLRSQLAPGTGCALEHGGVAPVIADINADFDAMLPLLVKGGFYHAGQVCVSVQKVFVHEDDCDALATALVALADKLTVGDPASDQTAVFTRDLDVAMDSVRKLNATAVMVNDHTAFRVDWMPFGGRGSSGLGMGSIPYSIHEMTREKLMVIKSPGL